MFKLLRYKIKELDTYTYVYSRHKTHEETVLRNYPVNETLNLNEHLWKATALWETRPTDMLQQSCSNSIWDLDLISNLQSA